MQVFCSAYGMTQPVSKDAAPRGRKREKEKGLNVEKTPAACDPGVFSDAGKLLAQTQFGDHCRVAARVFGFEVVQQFTAAANHAQQATATVVVFSVLFEVGHQVVDAGCQNSHLYFGAACVFGGAGVVGHDLAFVDRHDFFLKLKTQKLANQKGKLLAVRDLQENLQALHYTSLLSWAG